MSGKAPDTEGGGVSNRAVEIAVAVLIVALAVLVIIDSRRLGFRWSDDGPQAGYFPFYIGVLLGASGLYILLRAWRMPADSIFLTRTQARMVFSVLGPLALYVLAIQFLGIYVASTLFIALFMRWLGRYPWWKAVAVGAGNSIVFYLMFELWFKVPLLKGPLEALLGLH